MVLPPFRGAFPELINQGGQRKPRDRICYFVSITGCTSFIKAKHSGIFIPGLVVVSETAMCACVHLQWQSRGPYRIMQYLRGSRGGAEGGQEMTNGRIRGAEELERRPLEIKRIIFIINISIKSILDLD